MAQTVNNLPEMWETWVQSLGGEDPLEKEWLPTPVFLPGEFQGQKSLVGCSPWGCQESDTTEHARVLESSLIPFLLSHPILDPLANPTCSIFKTDAEADHFPSFSQPPPWPKPLSPLS